MTETSTRIPLTDETFPFTRSAAGQPKFQPANPARVAHGSAERNNPCRRLSTDRPKSLEEALFGATCRWSQ